MNVSKFSRAAAASLLIAGAAIATPASASDNLVRDLIVAPLVIGAVVAAATLPHLTVQTGPAYYDDGPRHVTSHRAPPPPPQRAPSRNHGRGW
jgi:hypothetical protein